MKGKVFNAQEVQSMIAGNMVMFREVIKKQPIQPQGFPDAYFDCYNKGNQWNWWTKDNKQLLGQIVKCPYQVGQKIFCKERLFNDGYQFFYDDEDGTILDKKDEKFWKRNCSKRVIPARNCPEWASRLTLQIKEIRVERLAEISEEDAVSEGIANGAYAINRKTRFAELWNATHKKPEEKWEADPFVFVYQFEIIK